MFRAAWSCAERNDRRPLERDGCDREHPATGDARTRLWVVHPVGADAEFGVDLRSKSAFLDPVTPRERRAPIRFALVLVFLVLLPAQITGALGAALAAAIDFAFNAPEKGYLHLFETRLVSPAVNYNDDLGQLAEALPNLFNNGVVAGLLLLFASRRAARRPLTFFTSQKRFRWRLFWTAMATTTAVYLAAWLSART
jgi:hypothetical protein